VRTAQDFAFELIPFLPNSRDSKAAGENIPEDLIGATITGFGCPPNSLRLQGGGLVIDYIPKGEVAGKRVVFAFNELGMWVEFKSSG
jgi:hypothetical protein